MNKISSVANYFPTWAPGNSRRHKVTSLASDLLPLFDLGCLLIAAWASNFSYLVWPTSAPMPDGNFHPAVLISVLFAPFFLYDRHFGSIAASLPLTPSLRSYALRYSLFVAIVLILMLVLMGKTGNAIHPGWLATWLTLGFLLAFCVRLLVGIKLRKLHLSGGLRESIAIVGAGLAANRFTEALRQSPSNAVELLGIFDDENVVATASSTKPDGNLAALIKLSEIRHIDWILLAFPSPAENQLHKILQQLKPLSVPIGRCPHDIGLVLAFRNIDKGPHRNSHANNELLGDCVPVTLLADQPIKRWNWVIKTGEDYLIGVTATILLLPVLAVIALAIRLESPGPIIFKQRRHTLNNREFDIYKFRTMRWEATPATENLRQTSRQDDRVTAVGRFLRSSSLDELPQLINVLKGDMSLIGPRPHATNMRTENQLGHEVTKQYTHRHRVKPGISGWAQVNGARGATDTMAQLRRRIELDLHYIDHWSVWLDLKILLKTFAAVLKQTNAF